MVHNRLPQLEGLPALSADELARYSRHVILPGVGTEGQRRLKAASVLLVGAGGLGSPLALYLAGAGVGRLGIVDFDRVDVSNLQRQVLHGTSDVGRRKTESARDRIADLNPHVEVETHALRLTSANALPLIAAYDIVVDGTDNFPTRYLTNDACVLLGKPNVYGSVFRFEGQASVFATPEGPCYRCLFREPPPPGLVPSCEEGGVFGVLPGLIGLIQATETIKLILGAGDTLVGRLLLVDALRMQFRSLQLRRDPLCPACGTHEITALIDYETFCGATVGNSDEDRVAELTPRELAERLARGDEVELIDVREPYEWEIARIPGARLVPLATLRQSVAAFPRDRDIVLYCKSGTRSATAARQLQAEGIRRVWQLAGGIARWGDDVDPTIRRY
ncbi:MAG: molybdopterin-synthase adenylyltransferase MoeB [Gemmatimonadota bacterium]|nr:molybdopterin-synthase adenylyltransferase MoeB [Gemmatimonadota bacterium]